MRLRWEACSLRANNEAVAASAAAIAAAMGATLRRRSPRGARAATMITGARRKTPIASPLHHVAQFSGASATVTRPKANKTKLASVELTRLAMAPPSKKRRATEVASIGANGKALVRFSSQAPITAWSAAAPAIAAAIAADTVACEAESSCRSRPRLIRNEPTRRPAKREARQSGGGQGDAGRRPYDRRVTGRNGERQSESAGQIVGRRRCEDDQEQARRLSPSVFAGDAR